MTYEREGSDSFSNNVQMIFGQCRMRICEMSERNHLKKHLLPLAPSRQPEKVNINLARPLHCYTVTLARPLRLAKSQHLAHGCCQCSHLNETPTPAMFNNEDGYKEDINVQNNYKKCSPLLPFCHFHHL